MTQTLLRSNLRIGIAAVVLVTVLAGLSLGCVLMSSAVAVRAVGGSLFVALLPLAFASLLYCCRPRIAIDERQLFVYVALFRGPVRIPLDVVEVFFIGQGPVSGDEPGHPTGYQGAVAANVIVRLAEQAPQWHDRKINQRMGVWTEGYITVRGMWCEDIDQDRLKEMNRALINAKRNLRDTASTGAQS